LAAPEGGVTSNEECRLEVLEGTTRPPSRLDAALAGYKIYAESYLDDEHLGA
jgi:hypothetical protein